MIRKDNDTQFVSNSIALTSEQLPSLIPATEHRNGCGYVQQRLLTVLPLLLSDLFAFTTCYLLGAVVANCLACDGSEQTWLGIALAFHLVIVFVLMDLYDAVGMHSVVEFRQVILSLGMLYLLAITHLLINQNPNTIAITFAFLGMLITVPVFRAATRFLFKHFSWWGVPTLVFSAHRRVNRLYGNHLKSVHCGVRPVGFIQSKVPEDCDEQISRFYMGPLESAAHVAKQMDVHCAIVHRFGRTDRELSRFIEKHLGMFSRVLIQPDDSRLPSLWVNNRNGGLSYQDQLNQPMSQFIKRAMDLSISVCLLLSTLPLFIAVAIWIRMTSEGPVFFGHERIGKSGRRFKAWKFRTMVTNGDEVLQRCFAASPELKEEWERLHKLKNDPRITLPGGFLRKSSLDELPQLWNVIRGEMSLVGPRPIITDEIKKYDEVFKTYLRATPGVTGLWQVSGRNLTTYDHRIELDDFYVRNWSPWFDLYVLGKTVKTVLLREGAF